VGAAGGQVRVVGLEKFAGDQIGIGEIAGNGLRLEQVIGCPAREWRLWPGPLEGGIPGPRRL
jgi:hypothetical protein